MREFDLHNSIVYDVDAILPVMWHDIIGVDNLYNGAPVIIDGTLSIKELLEHDALIHTIPTIIINVINHVDGRFFSLIRDIRQYLQFKGRIIVDGPVILDQYIYIHEMGADAVYIMDAASDAICNNALKPFVNKSYQLALFPNQLRQHIWHTRHQR